MDVQHTIKVVGINKGGVRPGAVDDEVGRDVQVARGVGVFPGASDGERVGTGGQGDGVIAGIYATAAEILIRVEGLDGFTQRTGVVNRPEIIGGGGDSPQRDVASLVGADVARGGAVVVPILWPGDAALVGCRTVGVTAVVNGRAARK